jgi:hypothetical protein
MDAVLKLSFPDKIKRFSEYFKGFEADSASEYIMG